MDTRSSVITTLVVTDRISRERLEYDDRTGLLNRGDVFVVGLPLGELTPQWLRVLDRRGQLLPGSVLLHHPVHPGSYVPADDFDWEVAQAKAATFSRLCQLLGAKKVEAVVAHTHTSDGSTEFDLSAKRPIGPELSGKATSTISISDVAEIARSDEFLGGEVDVDAARALLTQRGLEADPALCELVESRARTSNPHQSHRLTVNLSSEARRTLQASAKVRIPAMLDLDVDLNRVANEAATFKVTYEVGF